MLTAFVMCVTFFLSAQGVTITYDLNGGELSNGANSYQADSNNNNNAVLDNPTKTGYIFTGWCDTNDYTAATNTCSNRVGLVTTNNNNASKTMVRWTVPNDLSTDTTFIAMWEEDKFQVITTDLVVDDAIFGFYMTAAGKFWVDWGDGNVEYIDRTNNTNYTNYLHAYSVGNDGGFYTVRFTGLTTGYRQEVASTDWSIIPSPISFYNNTKVAGIGGSLGRLFPTIGATAQNDPTTGLNSESDYAVLNAIQPRFYKIFSGCTNLTGEIPEDLFVGVEGMPAEYMFNAIFEDCSGLTGSIPEKLFGRVVNNEYHGVKGAPSHRMFEEAFSGCTGLTGSIPANLFSGISGTPTQYMFARTFSDCSGLTGSIPSGLFSGISGAPATWMFLDTFSGCSGLTGSIPATLFSGISGAPENGMFDATFYGCSGLTGSIPANLFSGISGTPDVYMFEHTFSGCSGLTGSIPATLFSGISGTPAMFMFNGTFSGCSGLTGSIPATLFSGISGAPAEAMFQTTFSGCSNLGKDVINGTSTYYIPPTLFSGISKTTTGSRQMAAVFYDTGLLTSCPSGMSQYITGFEDYFNGRVSCMQSDRVLCSAGQTLCASCPDPNDCPTETLCPAGQAVIRTSCASCLDSNDCPTAPTQYTCPNGLLANPTHDGCLTGYTINYDLGGGTAINPSDYTAQTPTFTLNNPTKAGYKFTGWCVYNSAENTGANCANPEMSASITNGSTGDRWAYAQWKFQCPSTGMPNRSGIYALDPAWFDLDGNNSGANANECISMMYTMDDSSAAETCMYKALCNAAPDTAASMNVPCAQLESVTCDYATAGLSYATCRYNAQTYASAGFYTDCSTVVNVCNDADMLALLPAMGGQTDSAGLFPVELVKKGYNQTGSNVSNWNTYFGQSVLTLIPLVQNGMSFGDAWDTLNTYNTCSGGSTFTCESNTWLHVGNEQICTYATKTTDRALAIRVDANHVYYVMLTPASENDYPIHAGSNHKLKIREYNAAGTSSTIYNAHDMSVVSE